ncbi:MAG: hypothetical protein K9H64_16460 [Bacteroidales bacterium]|nr:hypothetical protein [Bacteroidales bacterium]
MNIEISENNFKLIRTSIQQILEIVKNISNEANRINTYSVSQTVFYDYALRLFPNLSAVNRLLYDLFHNKAAGNYYSIGLLLRGSLEDIMTANYLLVFKSYDQLLENEINIYNKKSLSAYIQFRFKEEPDLWTCNEQKRSFMIDKWQEELRLLKLDFPYYFNESGKIRNTKDLRKDISDYNFFFNANWIGEDGPNLMYKVLKKNDGDFSYIYHLYKYYCLFEHYSFQMRRVMVFDDYAFGNLAMSVEMITLGLKRICDYLNILKINYDKFKVLNNLIGKIIVGVKKD